ncbi:MAG: hypothetical protein NTV40_04450 [Solirubrobacterales bacterium]|nr:hypothetical protein [Solirubrobacterales bacterium]
MRIPTTKELKSARDLPWQMVIAISVQVGREGTKRWSRLSEGERQEVVAILKNSKARWSNLSDSERRTLRAIVVKALGPNRR